MSETIERVRQLIEARLHEVESEDNRLRGSLEALGGQKSRSPKGRGRGSKGRKRPRREGGGRPEVSAATNSSKP